MVPVICKLLIVGASISQKDCALEFGFTGLVVVFKFTETLVLPKLSQKTVASTSAAQ